MSVWHQMWCQLDNDEIASDLSGLAFIVVMEVIYCSDVLKLCHALLRTLPFTLIGLATNSDRSHCWQTPSETLETASTSTSHRDPIYFEALFIWTNNMYIARQAQSQTTDTLDAEHIHTNKLMWPSWNLFPSVNKKMQSCFYLMLYMTCTPVHFQIIITFFFITNTRLNTLPGFVGTVLLGLEWLMVANVSLLDTVECLSLHPLFFLWHYIILL